MKQRQPTLRSAGLQTGVTLIELMVALTIGLFVVFGLSTVFLNMKSTFVAQRSLADLHDAEQLSLTVLTTTLQSARFFPVDALNTKPDLALPLLAVPPSAGVPNFGAGHGLVASPTSSQLAVRMTQAPSDGLMDCLGNTNKTTANKTVVSIFQLDATTKELQCSVDLGVTWVPLVSGVSKLQFLFAVDTTFAGATPAGAAQRYMTAAQVVAAGLWGGVKSVQVTIGFDLPYANAGTGTIDWVQTINLMNQL